MNDNNHRAYVGPPHLYDTMGALQFNLLTSRGLRGFHTVLDIGCGSLRLGRLLIPYLNQGKYYGIEPNSSLVTSGFEHELGWDACKIKSPVFLYRDDFTCGIDGLQFDYIMAQSIFSHASQEQISKCLKEARTVSHKGTQFFATYYSNREQNYQGSEWVYPTCVGYTNDTIAGLAEAQGWVTEMLPTDHPNGQTWVRFTLQ